MRIIAGKYKGRRIEFGKELTDAIRPTSDFAREAIFNILTHGKIGLNGHTFADKSVLDLCCGTGAFGLEALSRGALHVTFIDQAREAIAIARSNIARMNETENAAFMVAEVSKLGRARQPYDVIFLDPPYFSGLIIPALKSLLAGGWLAEDAVIVAEHDSKETLALPPEFTSHDQRRYGRAMVEIIKAS